MKINTAKLNLGTLVAGGVVVTIVVVVISVFVLKGLFGKLSLNNQLLNKKRQAQQQLTKNLESLDSLRVEYDALGERKDLIKDALPTTANFPAIVSMMENLSRNAGVKMLSISPSTTVTGSTASAVPASGPQTFEFNASVSGSYSSFKEFLKNVELSVRPLAISIMSINSDETTVTVEMTIKSYFQAEFDPVIKTEPLQQSGTSGSSPSINVDPSNSSLNPGSGVSP